LYLFGFAPNYSMNLPAKLVSPTDLSQKGIHNRDDVLLAPLPLRLDPQAVAVGDKLDSALHVCSI
jgi:hypothetical protein